MSKENPAVLEMKHDEAHVRELRLVADVLNEQAQSSTAIGSMLLKAADRIEWLSQVASSFEKARREADGSASKGVCDV